MHQQKHQTTKKKIPKKNANNHNDINVTELLSLIASLEQIVDELKSESTIIKEVSKNLSNEIQDMHQYQRCVCVLVHGINTTKDED